MPEFGEKLVNKNIAIIPIATLILTMLVTLLYRLSEGIAFDPPYLYLVLNLIFWSIATSLILYISVKSFLRQQSFAVLLLSASILAFGVSLVVVGFILPINVNISVTVGGICYLGSALAQFGAGIVSFYGKEIPKFLSAKKLLAISYLGAIGFIALITALAWSGLFPPFFVSGPTILRQTVIVSAAALYILASLTFAVTYFKTQSPVVFWYSLAIAFIGIGLLSALPIVRIGDIPTWAGRIGFYGGTIYLIFAISKSRQEGTNSYSAWTEAFKANHEQISALFNNMIDSLVYGKITVDKNGKPTDWVFVDVNSSYAKIVGLKREQIMGKTARELFPDEVNDPLDWINKYGQVALTGKPFYFENYRQSLKKWLHGSCYSPKKGYFISVFEDITERKEAEEELKHQSAIRNGRNKMLQEALSSGTFEALGEVCLEVAQELTGSAFGFIGEVNERGLEDIAISNPGWTACVMYDQSGHRRSPGNFEIHGIYGRVLLDGKGFFTNEPASHPDRIGLPQGHPPLKSFIGVPLKNGDKVTGMIALANREGGYSKTEVDSLESLAPVIVEAFSRKRAEEALRQRTKQLEISQEKLEEKTVQLQEYSNRMEELANERLQKLKDSERLAAIGATAGMVGHDIRNPLQAITGDVYLAKTELATVPESEEKNNIQESLTEIEKNIDYINKIVQDLQDFARPLKPNAGEADLKIIIAKLLEKNGLPDNIEVSVKVEDAAEKVKADADYLNRILYNLVTNAVQAMPKGGKLTIHGYKEASDVVITVKDTGVGIPKAIQSKMFTPMFTTKAKGQGFGLPVVKRMTESLGGTVSFESQEGKGTTFKIRLPIKSK